MDVVTDSGRIVVSTLQELAAVNGGAEPAGLKEMHDGIVYKYLINGQWRTSTSGRTIQNLTPYDETVSFP